MTCVDGREVIELDRGDGQAWTDSTQLAVGTEFRLGRERRREHPLAAI